MTLRTLRRPTAGAHTFERCTPEEPAPERRPPGRRPPLTPSVLLVLGILLPALVSVAAPPPLHARLERPQKAKVELLADRSAYPPGSTARLAAVMVIEKGWHTNSHRPSYDWLIPTDLTLTLPESWTEPEITYPEGGKKAFSYTDGPISIYEGTVRFLTSVPVPEDASGTVPVTAALRYQACDHSTCLPPVTAEASLELTLGPGGEPTHGKVFAAGAGMTAGPDASTGGRSTTTSTGRSTGGTTGLVAILLLGFLGGVILNVMPCVLPVLSLKIFGLIRSADEGRGHVVAGGLATTAGILASFLALAGAAVLARSAGAAVGWGTQFQHPGFVTFLAVVVLLFCLNLWGLFEIQLPHRLAQAVSSGPTEGHAGHFASGLFATLMATPCSAPFLGTAVGFALTQPAWKIFLTFTAIGLGMSLPYLMLAVAPGTARLFPKPGAWMEHVRRIMGFLLAAAAVWLLYVLSAQVSPERLALVELGLLGLALFVWMGSRMASSRPFKRVAAAALVIAAVGTVVLAARPDAGAQSAGGRHDGRIEWVEFDRQEAMARAAGGRLVFVDVTADWCLTCKANERLVLESDEVADAFSRHRVLPMKADWTNRDDTIGEFLADFGKAGIPFYVLYSPDAEPHVFSELLTRDAVVSALTAAAASLDGAQEDGQMAELDR
jgi:thiol:disulfide interchange protein